MKFKPANPSFKLLILGLSVLFLMLSFLLKSSYDSVIDRVAQNADNVAIALEGQLNQTFRRIESNLLNIARRMPVESLRLSNVPRYQNEIIKNLQDYTQNFPEVKSFSVWDENGDSLYHSRWAMEDTGKRDITSRDGFISLKNNPSINLVFSGSILGRVDQQPTMGTFYAIRNDAGKLIGVVTATLDINHFSNIYKAISLGEGSTIFIRRSDDQSMIIRYPPLSPGTNFAFRNPIQDRIDAGQFIGRERFKAVVDGQYRLFSYRKVAGYPFYVVVGVSEKNVLQHWKINAGLVGLGFASALLMLIFMYRRLRRSEVDQVLARKSAEMAYQVLEEAVKSVSVGFSIYDHNDKLLLCNEAYLEMYQTSRDLIVPGAAFEEIIRKGAQRGQYSAAIGRVDAWVAERLMKHQNAHGQATEQKLDDGRYVLVVEHKTPSGLTVGNRTDITQIKNLEAELRALATIDGLTGLPNRRDLMNQLTNELHRIHRQPEIKSCVLMVDLDHFKSVNDTHGHVAGDMVLKHFSAILKDEMRVTDHAGRFGGEEFAVLLTGSTTSDAGVFAERLRTRMEQLPTVIEDQKVYVTISIGISEMLDADDDIDAAIKRADAALYRAKNSGRNQVAVDGAVAPASLFD